MTHDFDTVIDRRNTGSLKHDGWARRGKPQGLTPLWVADMDFQSPPCVLEALRGRVEHGVFGYSETVGGGYFEALRAWYKTRFGWGVKEDWLVQSPGVVFALYNAVRAFTSEGDAVMIQQPVYAPFTSAVLMNQRRLVVNHLTRGADGRYEMDFDALEREMAENDVRLFFLCNPHNPVGRSWTTAELARLGHICRRRGVIVISDEIHQDFVYAPHRHTVFADVEQSAFAGFTVTCTAPTKTFNLAGLQAANIWIADQKLRARFVFEQQKSGYSQLTAMGLLACQAAYAGGAAWLDELLAYLRGNADALADFLARRLPQIGLTEVQATYLAWLDCAALGLDGDTLERRVTQAGLWLDGGAKFGEGGAGFLRLNFAAPRVVLDDALTRLDAALR